jgi:Dolichyl-phosphate-mannose-protein mannosyltransferase
MALRSLSPAARESRWWLIGMLILVAIIALPVLRYPLDRDQATYSVIAEGLLKGKHLYRDLWDNKPPGIFYIYTVFVTIFGRVMWFVGVVDYLYLLLVSYCIYRFAARYLGAPAGAIAAILYAFWHEQGGYHNAAQSEEFIVLLVFLAFFLVIKGDPAFRPRHFAAGVALGAAFWIKYNAGVFLIPIAFLPYADASQLDLAQPRLRMTIDWKSWHRRMTALAAGFAAPCVLVLGYSWLAGSWPAMKQVQFEVLPRYAAMFVERTPHYALWTVGAIMFALHAWREAGVAVALVLAWRRHEIGRLFPVICAALAGFLVTATQARFNSYYFETCLPFLAMICAYVPVALFWEFRLLSERFAARRMRVAQVLVWIVFANFLYFPSIGPVLLWTDQARGMIYWMQNPQRSYVRYWSPDYYDRTQDQAKVIRYIKAHSRPSDEIFVWGTAPIIYFLTGREAASRFVSNLGPISAWAPPEWRTDLVRDLKKKPPLFIIVARHDALFGITYTPLDSEQYLKKYPALAHLLAQEYAPVENLADFEIFRRKNGSGGARQ